MTMHLMSLYARVYSTLLILLYQPRWTHHMAMTHLAPQTITRLRLTHHQVIERADCVEVLSLVWPPFNRQMIHARTTQPLMRAYRTARYVVYRWIRQHLYAVWYPVWRTYLRDRPQSIQGINPIAPTV